MDERLPGVRVPTAMVEALEAAGEDAHRVGLELTVEVVRQVRADRRRRAACT